MGYRKRAIRYLAGNKSKTIILFLVLLIAEAMLLCTGTILRATQESIHALKEKTKSKIIAEISDEKEKIGEEELRQINDLIQVKLINREAKARAYPSGFQVLSGSQSTEPDNQQVQLTAYDDLEADGAFADGQIRLREGRFPEKENEVVVNQLLASLNQWQTGDVITIRSEAGKTMEAVISGCFLSGTERNQAEEMNAVYRIENTIYAKPKLVEEIQEEPGYERVFVYLKDPEAMEEAEQILAGILGDKAELSRSDTLYSQMKQPLEQVLRVVRLMLYLTAAAAVIVVTLLLCMWMRSRKKEVAVYISLGEGGRTVFMQMLLESLLVYMSSLAAAAVIGGFLAEWMKNLLFAEEAFGQAVSIHTGAADLGILMAFGCGILLADVGIALVPVLRTKPRETLSEMEG